MSLTCSWRPLLFMFRLRLALAQHVSYPDKVMQAIREATGVTEPWSSDRGTHYGFLRQAINMLPSTPLESSF